MVKYFSILLLGLLLLSPSNDLFNKYLKIEKQITSYLKIEKQITSYTYQYEAEDYWKSPDETIRDKGGDCEDFAILGMYLFDNYLPEANSRMYIIYTDEDKSGEVIGAHAVTLFNNAYETVSMVNSNTIVYTVEKTDTLAILTGLEYINPTSIYELHPVKYGDMGTDRNSYYKSIGPCMWEKLKRED